MAKFYMHNLILTHMNHWDPNSRMGDVKLMALASQLTHEEVRDEEIKRVMGREVSEPLWVKSQLRSRRLVASKHNLIEGDPKLEPSYIGKQEEAILHFADTFRLPSMRSYRLVKGGGTLYEIPKNERILVFRKKKKCLGKETLIEENSSEAENQLDWA